MVNVITEVNVDIDLDDIDENEKMRLKYMESMIKNSNTRKLTTIMKLGKICNFKNGKALTSSNFIDGINP